MSATKVTTTTQGSQAPSPKKVAKPAAAEGEKKEKAPRKPTLKEKHSRFLVSNYSLIQFLSSKGLLTDEGVESAYTEIKLFAPVDEQEAFYESYITESKTTKKAMNKFIKERNKPPKAPKKTRAKKAEGDAPAPKKTRAKKTTKVANDTEVDVVAQVTSDNATDLVNELTAAATAAPATPEPNTNATTEAPGAPKKTRKPRAKKAEGDAPKEKKPRATKKSKKEEAPPAPVEAAAPVQEEEDEEIHTQEIEINGKSYLIDGDNNLYSVDTHDEIGTYDAENNTITAV